MAQIPTEDSFGQMENIKIEMGSTSSQPNPDLDKQEMPHGWHRSVESKSEADQESSMMRKYLPCLHYMVLKPYFDIKTEDIKKRLIASLNPMNRQFLDLYKEKPDLYGPFWILTTLVVVFSISGNLARYETMGEENFTYNFKIIPKAFATLFIAAALIPFGITMAVKFLGTGSEIHILYAVGVYSYSYTSFLISGLLCSLIPINIIQWILLLASTAVSLGFLALTYQQDFSEHLENSKRQQVIAGVCLAQFGILYLIKVGFYSHV